MPSLCCALSYVPDNRDFALIWMCKTYHFSELALNVTLMSVTSALHFVHSHSLTPVCCLRSWLKKVFVVVDNLIVPQLPETLLLFVVLLFLLLIIWFFLNIPETLLEWEKLAATVRTEQSTVLQYSHKLIKSNITYQYRGHFMLEKRHAL